MKPFKFDYDFKYDDLFLYDGSTRSKGSICVNDVVVDLNSKKELSALQFMNATRTLGEILGMQIERKLLKDISGCKVGAIRKNGVLNIRFVLEFRANKTLSAPIMIAFLEPDAAVA